MVEDRITDGTRIAELLASELSGLETGSLEQVDVVDADRDATPSETGTEAYRLTYQGQGLGRVLLYPDSAKIHVEPDVEWFENTERSSIEDDTLRVDSGAGVKDAVDALRQMIATLDTN